MTTDVIIQLLADGLVIPIALLGTWALVAKVPAGQHYHAYTRVLMAGLSAYTIAKLLGLIFQPDLTRPFETMGVEPGASFLNNPGFPSDHVLFCAAITLAVWFETRVKYIALLLAILTALVALGRVLALVHTPLDVLGGMAIATIGALWYLQTSSTKAKKPSTI